MTEEISKENGYVRLWLRRKTHAEYRPYHPMAAQMNQNRIKAAHAVCKSISRLCECMHAAAVLARLIFPDYSVA